MNGPILEKLNLEFTLAGNFASDHQNYERPGEKFDTDSEREEAVAWEIIAMMN